MLDIDRPAAEVVSDHCALRYLDRVLGVKVDSFAAEGETTRLRNICAVEGFRPEVLKATILSPAVRIALALGAEKVLVDGFWLAFTHGRVVTVLYPEQRHRRGQRARSTLKRFTQSPRRGRARFDLRDETTL